MNEEDFIIFPNTMTGIRQDRIMSWLPAEGAESQLDENGNPVKPITFYLMEESGARSTITIYDTQDVKRFLAGAWNRSLLVNLLVETCQQALDWIDAEYNEGEIDDPRPHWGDCKELDDLHNQLGRMIALARGLPFTARE